jgi:nitroimidazol reductase NimA-like FMN-containing flavoprotein (pyridoxamine 5'-phosphate oxidase superfamily)
MREDIKDLVIEKDVCVMATVSGGKPHCSLMSYVVDDQCHEIYMVTQKNTKKYTNMLENPFVSLLIDNREQHVGADRQNAKALTISGTFQEIDDNFKKNAARNRLLERRPHLKVFLDDPGTEIFCVKINSFLLLDGLTNAYSESLTTRISPDRAQK